MAAWKLIVVSGSDAKLSSLQLDTVLPVGSGGTGQSTLSSGQVLLGAGASGVTSVTRGTLSGTSQVLITGGTSAVLGTGTTIGLGGDVASGSKLNDISKLTATDSVFIVGNGTTWVGESGATARTSIGLGTGDSPSFNGLSVTNATGTASFSGAVSATSYYGDGSNLTGLTPSAVESYTNAADNRVLTSVNSTGINGEANLTFDGTVLGVTGKVTVSTAVTASTAQLTGLGTGVDNTVVVVDTQGNLKTDEIDARVWGTSLVDGSGANTRLAYWSDADTLTSNASLTFNGTVVTVGSSTFGTNTFIAGNLVVAGTASFQNASSLLVADRFVMFNSGSATGDGGFIVQSETNGTGMAVFFDDSATRFAFQMETTLGPGASAGTLDAYLAAVVDVDGGTGNKASSVHLKSGNIMISGSEAWIYI